MELITVLHMKRGIDDASYAKNSLLQQKVILMTKPIIEEAITNLYRKLCCPKSLSIADLGCSSGPNTLSMVSLLIKTIEKTCTNMNHESPEFHIYLNDLYRNDFNALFNSLPCFRNNLKKDLGSDIPNAWFFNGVPGSFYHRLFPRNSIHFVHSSYSLQWLSQVPEGIENNKGDIYMTTRSPPNIIKAYREQFKKDFLNFLKFRSIELVSSGQMVITYLGRESEDPLSKESCYIWELLATVLKQMVFKGIIEEKKLDSFNIPQYLPSPKELKYLVEKEGSFRIDRLKVTKVHWNAFDGDTVSLVRGSNDSAYNVAKCMRAVAEPLLVNHFGETIMNEVFCEYEKIISDCMLKEKTEFINVTVSMTKIN